MIPKAYPSSRRFAAEGRAQIGADIGATLAKLAIRRRDGELDLRLIPSSAIDRLASEIESSGAKQVVLTGGGALQLAEVLGLDGAPVNEFEAWAAGARAILHREEREALANLSTAELLRGGVTTVLVPLSRSNTSRATSSSRSLPSLFRVTASRAPWSDKSHSAPKYSPPAPGVMSCRPEPSSW